MEKLIEEQLEELIEEQLEKRKRWNWKDITDDDYIVAIMAFWEMYKKDGSNNKFVDHLAYIDVRSITYEIGKRRNKSKISKKAQQAQENIHVHHKVPAIWFFDQFRECARKGKEFTEKDAKEWLDKSLMVYLTKEEHKKIHNKTLKIEDIPLFDYEKKSTRKRNTKEANHAEKKEKKSEKSL